MIIPLIPPEDSLLHQKIKGCSYNLDRSKLVYTLHENMFHYNGVGLSANQLGIDERVFVMISNMESQETITCFNPKIIKESKDEVVMEEGCLSSFLRQVFQDELNSMFCSVCISTVITQNHGKKGLSSLACEASSRVGDSEVNT